MEFFDLLQNLCDKNKIAVTTIYNMDESGFSTVAKKCQKVVTLKGVRAVGSVASGERGVNTTIVCCVSAAGWYIPPMLIFKRKRYTAELSNDAPPGSMVDISDSGYITSELFVKWLQHFINIVHPSKEKKLPGHTTHRLQPLDRSFFKPYGSLLLSGNRKMARSNPGRVITQYQVGEQLRSKTLLTDSKAAGVWPINRNVFQDSDFVASDRLCQEHASID
ncbi:hypothetical protein NQ318_001793 [Aromia moschata]|uniref:DDE-1 domain-containing protein n=1 Tax=Aromia moschata TaxID=1265417 RepID=A0AAV8X0X6_9CUCU|nr:hypothetical protein NQ318_001793 [Aromia moschata]